MDFKNYSTDTVYTMWKSISELDGRYDISDCGEIRNNKTSKILCKKLDRDGYYQIGLRKLGDRKKIWFYIHRLVALYFLGPPDNENNQVDHIDNNKTNNKVENLRWVTQLDNNLNRKLQAWKSNTTTNELYITKYKNGFMIRINRSDYSKRLWCKDLNTAVYHRNNFINEMNKNILSRRD